MKLTVTELAKQLGAELTSDTGGRDRQISAVGPIDTAGENEITFVVDDKFAASLKSSQAGAAIVSKHIDGVKMPQLIVKNVNAALIEALSVFAPKLKAPAEGIDPTAKVAEDARIARGVSIEPFAVIDNGVEIGENTVIGSGCKIGENSKLGSNCRLDSNVVIYHNCTLGNNVVIQANSTVGSTGFGYSFIEGSHRLIPHNGGVVIEDFVEIGANCCIDRAKFNNTVIGAGTKIDNLVQIAHNVIIGKCCLIVAQVGISGSSKIGNGVVLAGQVGLADNIEIGDGAMIAAHSGVMSSVPAGQKMAWTPAIKKEDAFRTVGHILRLPKMAAKLKELGKRLDKLEAAEDDKE